jgi:hypothetical protein
MLNTMAHCLDWVQYIRKCGVSVIDNWFRAINYRLYMNKIAIKIKVKTKPECKDKHVKYVRTVILKHVMAPIDYRLS